MFELSPKIFSKDGVESTLDIISNDKNDWYSFKMALELKNIKAVNTYLYSSLREIFHMNTAFVENKVVKNDTYISGGYVEKEIKFYKKEKLPPETLDFHESLLVPIEEILNLLEQKQIECVFVSAPIAPSTYQSYTNNVAFDSVISTYAPYYNFNEILQLDDSLHFYNAQHLNQNGVEIFNAKLIEILKDRKLN